MQRTAAGHRGLQSVRLVAAVAELGSFGDLLSRYLNRIPRGVRKPPLAHRLCPYWGVLMSDFGSICPK
jgi:hypothetical protein